MIARPKQEDKIGGKVSGVVRHEQKVLPSYFDSTWQNFRRKLRLPVLILSFLGMRSAAPIRSGSHSHPHLQDAGQESTQPAHSRRRSGDQRPFFSRFSAFFSAGVFSGFFLVCFWEFCDLAMM